MFNDSGHETALFHQIAQGDESAFEALFHLYVPKIKPVITRIIQVEGAEKDIIQEIFLGIWLSREKLTDILVPHNWIFKIVYHRCYSWLQKQGVRNKATQVITRESLDHSNLTEENLAFTEISTLVKQAIHQLPPQAQKIYLMSRETDLKISEIADLLQLSPQTVKNSLVRSLKSIREYLTGHGITLPLILLGAGLFQYA
jgi:RNA polymerase sigma-70 factor (family 1)